MEVVRIEDGLWRWTTHHPAWRPGTERGPEVSGTFVEAGGSIVLVDPPVPLAGEQADRFWRALDRDLERAGTTPVVILTTYRHRRSAGAVAARYAGTQVLAPAVGREAVPGQEEVTSWFGPGDALPAGLEAVAAVEPGEVALWVPAHEALVVGDVLRGVSGGLCLRPDGRPPGGIGRAALAGALRPLLELPLARVLTAHGPPVLEEGRARLAEALA